MRQSHDVHAVLAMIRMKTIGMTKWDELVCEQSWSVRNEDKAACVREGEGGGKEMEKAFSAAPPGAEGIGEEMGWRGSQWMDRMALLYFRQADSLMFISIPGVAKRPATACEQARLCVT